MSSKFRVYSSFNLEQLCKKKVMKHSFPLNFNGMQYLNVRLNKFSHINVIVVVTERIHRSFTEAQPREVDEELNPK